MDCELYQVGIHEDGRALYRCRHCDQPETPSRQSDPKRIHRPCLVPRSIESIAQPHIEQLPEASRLLLIGDRIKQLTDALGIPQCGGCAKRQEWLNKAHAWVMQKFS